MTDFDGKTALVTGGTSGIGLAAARAFAEAGARVAVTGRDADRLEAARAVLGPDGLAVRADVATAEGRAAAAEAVERAFGGLDAVFLNAGIVRFAPIEEVDEDSVDALFAVNVKGVLFTLQALLPLLRDGAGVVVNTSINNAIGMPGTAGYAASKAAARSLVRVMAAELAPRGIRVNAVSPGPVETPIFGTLGLPEEQLAGIAETLRGKVPLGRFGDPAEIARAVLFLTGGGASFVTGAELVADGGWTQIAA